MIEKNVISNIFSKRMSELFDLRVENDKDILEGLSELSEFLDKNSPENRRNLKSLIEERTMQINHDFLNNFRVMTTSFGKVSKNLNEMNTALNEMKSSLAVTKHKTKTLIERTLAIQQEVDNVSLKKDIVSKIIERFQLTPTELAALRITDVTSDIFSVLEKVEQIMKDCRLLLETGNHNIAQDIMEQMVVYQDTGMDRLFRWVREKCNTSEATSASALLPQALSKLQKKSNLFEQILEEISANRSIILVRHFIDALTLGGRPIEHKVTEPLQYIGDMLAWLHQALPSEIEYLNFILGSCENSDELVQSTLSKITEGIVHPLKVRVEHVLLGEENSHDSVLLKDIYSLLKDYEKIIFQVIRNSRLNTTFTELSEVAEKSLLLSLQNNVSSLLSSERETVSSNLLPSSTTEKIVSLLGHLLSTETASQTTENHVLQLVSCALDPTINRITELASKLSTVEMAVYLLNNFHYIETSLALFPFLDDRLERLKAQCDAQIDTLTSEQASAMVGHLSLGSIYTVLQGNPTKPLSSISGLDPLKLSIVSNKLEKLLSSPHLYHLPQIALLMSANHKIAVQKRSFAVITSIYSNLYEAVYNPKNGYRNPSEILPISPEVVNNTLTQSQ